MVDALKSAGVPVPLTTWREYEAGSRLPGDDRIRAFEDYFGSSPQQPVTATETPAALIDALMRQSVALEAQTLALRANTDAVTSLARAVAAMAANSIPLPEAQRAMKQVLDAVAAAQTARPQDPSRIDAGVPPATRPERTSSGR